MLGVAGHEEVAQGASRGRGYLLSFFSFLDLQPFTMIIHGSVRLWVALLCKDILLGQGTQHQGGIVIRIEFMDHAHALDSIRKAPTIKEECCKGYW